MKASLAPLRCVVGLLLALGWAAESSASVGGGLQHVLSLSLGAVATDYDSCQWASSSTSGSWIRDRYLSQGDFSKLGCPLDTEVLVPGQTDGRYTYQRFEFSNKCIAWNWNKADVWTSPGNYEEMDCSQVRGLQQPTTPAGGNYYSCQLATPSSSDSWIRARYLNHGDYALLGCPITEETLVPGQTDGRYMYQRFELGNKCIAWNWNKADVWTSPGNYEEMDCGQVRGLQQPTPPPGNTGNPSAGCGKTQVVGDMMRRSTANGRTYYLHVPAGVSSTAQQKLIFVWHGCNTSVSDIRGSYGMNLEVPANQAGDKAIFVYPQAAGAPDAPAQPESCFDGDLTSFDQMLSDIKNAYCLDTHKVFSTGYSSGGIVSEFLGCQRSSVIRGIAPVEGGRGASDTSACPGKVDALIIHNPLDEQIGWNAPATYSGGWKDGRGFIPLQQFYSNDGCYAPALSGSDTAIQKTVFTCPAPYRVTRILHNSYYAPSPIGHHVVPHGPSPIPDATYEVWNFFNAAQ
jgi:poly(3-hydroxybutyrate) depolymerase